MILFKNFRERIKLLEYENEILTNKIKALEKHVKYKEQAQFPCSELIRENGWDLSYDTLRKKHRYNYNK